MPYEPRSCVSPDDVLDVARIDAENAREAPEYGWKAEKRAKPREYEPKRYRGANKTLYAPKYGFEYIVGNSLPYFHIVMDSWRPNHPSQSGGPFGGCMHDEIAQQWPKLAYLIKWHLHDGDGTPMHYVANALWWRGMVLGMVAPDKYARYAPADIWAQHVVYGILPDDIEEPHQALVGADEEWLLKRLPAIQQAFKDDMKKAGFILPDVWQSRRKE